MAESPPDDVLITPEPPASRGPDLPDLRDWGGVERVKKEVRRSATIMANREAIAYELLCMGSTKITDVMSWDEAGVVKFKPSAKLDHRHARMIKAVEQRLDKEGNVVGLKLTLFDKTAVLRLLAQCAGLMRKDPDEDKPAVVGVRVRGPRRKTVTIEGEK